MRPLSYTAALFAALLWAGCLAEVEMDELDFAPHLVVQGFPRPDSAVTVVLSRTRALWDPANFDANNEDWTGRGWISGADTVFGASAVLEVNGAARYAFAETAPGRYEVPLSAYRPAHGDRLRLTVEAGGLRATAETTLPERLPAVSFSAAVRPGRDTILVWFNGQTGLSDSTYVFQREVDVAVTFADAAPREDFYAFDVKSRSPVASFKWSHGSSHTDLLRADDRAGPGRALRFDQHADLSVYYRPSHEPLPEYPFPVAEPDTFTVEVRARLLQYGVDYDRFLRVDRFPLNNETGSNVEGGVGLFAGVAEYDTTLAFSFTRTGPVGL